MKILVISMAKEKERREYITSHLNALNCDYVIIEAVDGSKLSLEEKEKLCDMAEVNKYPWWLNNGAIGCALSHYNAYEYIVNNNLEAALIIEDDVILPRDINTLMEKIGAEIYQNEVVMLYYISPSSLKLSNIYKTELPANESLLFPVDITYLLTTSAYIITNKAAQGMLSVIKPIKVAADNWKYFYDMKAFSSFRVLFPMRFDTKNYKSSINYFEGHPFKRIVSDIINKYKIPPFYYMLSYIRQKKKHKLQSQFSLTDDVSPIFQNLKKEDKLKMKNSFKE